MCLPEVFFPKWQSTFWLSPWLNFHRVFQCKLRKKLASIRIFLFRCGSKIHGGICRTEIHLFYHLTNTYIKASITHKITALTLVAQAGVKIRYGVHKVRRYRVNTWCLVRHTDIPYSTQQKWVSAKEILRKQTGGLWEQEWVLSAKANFIPWWQRIYMPKERIDLHMKIRSKDIPCK